MSSVHRQSKQTGFTLMELVAIVSLLAILSVVAFARLNVAPFRDAGFDQELRSAIRFAQKFAMTSGCDVQVVINGTGYNLQLRGTAVAANPPCPMGAAGGFDTALRNPATGSAYSGAPGSGVAIGGALTFFYDRQGSPDFGGTQTVMVGTRTITIEAGTGFVY
jgi:MSHA pilin protein MshC